jgi:hypothetical protein
MQQTPAGADRSAAMPTSLPQPDQQQEPSPDQRQDPHRAPQQVPLPLGLALALARPGGAVVLRAVLLARFGTTQRGRLALPEVAGALGVTVPTVRRWLRTPPDRAPLSAARALQLAATVAPNDETRTRERLDVEHAEEQLRRLALGRGRGGMQEQYRDTGWLDPHVVAILELPYRPPRPGPDVPLVRRVAVTRASLETVDRMQRGVDLVDFTSTPLPNRFAATLLRAQILQQVNPWRLVCSSRSVARVEKGHTRAWLSPAPLAALDDLARAR